MLEDFSEFPVRKSLLHNLKGWCPSQEMNESITSDTSDQSSEPYLNSTNTGGPQSGKTVNLITLPSYVVQLWYFTLFMYVLISLNFIKFSNKQGFRIHLFLILWWLNDFVSKAYIDKISFTINVCQWLNYTGLWILWPLTFT